MTNIFSCAYLFSVYLLHWIVCTCLLPIFNWILKINVKFWGFTIHSRYKPFVGYMVCTYCLSVCSLNYIHLRWLFEYQSFQFWWSLIHYFLLLWIVLIEIWFPYPFVKYIWLLYFSHIFLICTIFFISVFSTYSSSVMLTLELLYSKLILGFFFCISFDICSLLLWKFLIFLSYSNSLSYSEIDIQ